MRTFLKWLGVTMGAVIAALAITIVVAGLLHEERPTDRTPSGIPRFTSVYVTMTDGVRIAVDVALPADVRTGQNVPALIKGLPYWRGLNLTFLGKAAAQLHVFDTSERDVALLNERGYAVITADTRGTGASFGHLDILFGEREIADFGELIDWAARQPWSDGRVGAYGFSYRGMLAVNMASLGRPALKAVAPSFEFPDVYLSAYPGGVFSERFVRTWSEQTGRANRGELPCGLPCKLLVDGPRRVDADVNGTLVQQAILEHAADYDAYDCMRKAPHRDAPFCTSGTSLSQVSQIARRAAIERSGIPMYVTAGYFDANSALLTLRRFAQFSNTQTLVLGAVSHGGFRNTDPFAPPRAPPDPSYSAQIAGMADFFDIHVKHGSAPAPRSIHYAVLNGGGWKTTDVWPPRGNVRESWYLAAEHALARTAPAENGSDVYEVDFSASSGRNARYPSPADLSRTEYPDRAAQDQKLIVYTSTPLNDGLEISGNPVAHLQLKSTATDGVVIVYLELVAPDRTVTYVTEGLLRLAHRKRLPAVDPVSGDPYHSYLSADAEQMTPGSLTSVTIEMFPVAIRLRKGDRVRISIAGADAGNLERIPPAGGATLSLERGGPAGSFVELPIAPPAVSSAQN